MKCLNMQTIRFGALHQSRTLQDLVHLWGCYQKYLKTKCGSFFSWSIISPFWLICCFICYDSRCCFFYLTINYQSQCLYFWDCFLDKFTHHETFFSHCIPTAIWCKILACHAGYVNKHMWLSCLEIKVCMDMMTPYKTPIFIIFSDVCITLSKYTHNTIDINVNKNSSQ